MSCYDSFNGLELMFGFCVGIFVSFVFVLVTIDNNDE
jgi:hypothetical protein